VSGVAQHNVRQGIGKAHKKTEKNPFSPFIKL